MLVVVSPSTSSADQAMAGDRATLTAISRSISGWPAGSGWGSKTKVTTWWGVQVEESRVTALDLGNRGNDQKLTGEDNTRGDEADWTTATAPSLIQNIFPADLESPLVCQSPDM